MQASAPRRSNDRDVVIPSQALSILAAVWDCRSVGPLSAESKPSGRGHWGRRGAVRACVNPRCSLSRVSVGDPRVDWVQKAHAGSAEATTCRERLATDDGWTCAGTNRSWRSYWGRWGRSVPSRGQRDAKRAHGTHPSPVHRPHPKNARITMPLRAAGEDRPSFFVRRDRRPWRP